MIPTLEIGRQVPVIAGAKILDRLDEICHQHHARSVLIVSDVGVENSGMVAQVMNVLGHGFISRQFIAPPGEPTTETVDRGAAMARILNAPLVLGIGGGTVMDIAKLVAALVKNSGCMADYMCARKPWAGRAPLVLIPTTAGTGSEVTRTAIVSDIQGRKQWSWGDELLPDAVLLDSALTCHMPQSLTAVTGLDALIHAIEAATGQRRNGFIEAPALQAIRLISQSLPTVIHDPDDLAGRQNMQIAACLAGQAIDNGGTGLGHNIGHALGTLYHLPHGVAVTLGVEATLAWSVEAMPDTFAAVADALVGSHSSCGLPNLFTALIDRANFNVALAPFNQCVLDTDALADAMQAKENAPMARNAARCPGDSDWRALAGMVVSVFNHRTATLRQKADPAEV